MAPHESDLLLAPRKTAISFAVEPALNNIHSLIMLSQEKYHSGLGEWVTRMAATLPPERLHTNRLVFEGLYSAIVPERSWPSFPAYVDYLAAQPPEALRDRLLRAILRPCPPETPGAAPIPPPDPAVLLGSAEAYVAHLWNIYPDADIDEPIEIETHALLNNLPAMHDLIVTHMRAMWHATLAAEWERVAPMVQESASAFQQLDLGGLSALEAARTVTGQELAGKWEQAVAGAGRVVFVPSAHIGPYVGKFKGERTLWMLFGARLPAGAQGGSSALSRSDLLVRLSALTDDTRLLILGLLSQHEELCAQDIIVQLDLSQSAASRHLRQLSATGYLTERRRDGAKCYSLNRDRIDDTFRALGHFLTKP